MTTLTSTGQLYDIVKLAGSLDDAAVCVDLQGTITYLNRSAEKMFGYQIPDLTGLRFADTLLLKTGRNGFISALHALQNGREGPITLESRMMTRTGRKPLVKNTLTPLRGADNDVEGFLITISKPDIRIGRKKDEITKTLTLLEQSEDLARMGSWEYDAGTEEFKWSSGMYRLFNLPEGSPVTPETYLEFASPDSRISAAEIVRQLRIKQQSFELIVRIRNTPATRVLRVRGTAIRNHSGKTLKMLGVNIDITDHFLSEEKLREQSYFIAQITDSTPDIIFVLDLREARLIYVNRRAQEVFGLNEHKIYRQGSDIFRLLLHPNDLAIQMKHIRNLSSLNYDESNDMELRLKVATGDYHWFRVRDCVFRRNERGTVTHTVGLATDITAEKQALGNLLKKENLLREAERIGNMGSWEHHLPSNELIWSDELFRIYGFSPDEISPDTTYLLNYIVHPDDKEKVQKHVEELWVNYKPVPCQYRIVKKNGEVRTVFSEPEILFGENEQPEALMGIITDITEKIRLESEAHHLRVKRQNEVLHAVLKAQEEERRRIAEMLHNDLGQLLYIARIKAGDSRTSGKEVQDILNISIERARTMAFELMPSILQDYGLDTSLKDLVKRSVSQGLNIVYTNSEPLKRLDSDMEVNIFRIIQELLNNVVKHSSATKASVDLFYDKNEIKIEVEDNGIGFPEVQTKGLGLRNIRHRLQVHAGRMILLSGFKTTKVIITLKYPAA